MSNLEQLEVLHKQCVEAIAPPPSDPQAPARIRGGGLTELVLPLQQFEWLAWYVIGGVAVRLSAVLIDVVKSKASDALLMLESTLREWIENKQTSPPQLESPQENEDIEGAIRELKPILNEILVQLRTNDSANKTPAKVELCIRETVASLKLSPPTVDRIVNGFEPVLYGSFNSARRK